MKCEKHGHYHEDHGCGTAVYIGSSYGEHIINCPLGFGSQGFFKANDGKRYPPWEAPAPNCPGCWHEAHPDQEILEFSAFGQAAKTNQIVPGQDPKGYKG